MSVYVSIFFNQRCFNLLSKLSINYLIWPIMSLYLSVLYIATICLSFSLSLSIYLSILSIWAHLPLRYWLLHVEFLTVLVRSKVPFYVHTSTYMYVYVFVGVNIVVSLFFLDAKRPQQMNVSVRLSVRMSVSVKMSAVR